MKRKDSMKRKDGMKRNYGMKKMDGMKRKDRIERKEGMKRMVGSSRKVPWMTASSGSQQWKLEINHPIQLTGIKGKSHRMIMGGLNKFTTK